MSCFTGFQILKQARVALKKRCLEPFGQRMDGNLDGKESALRPEQFGEQVVGFAHYPGGGRLEHFGQRTDDNLKGTNRLDAPDADHLLRSVSSWRIQWKASAQFQNLNGR